MAQRQSPVIPEIAQAFQNDPRTRIAQGAIGAGTSVAPVAAGKYAWADGIARVLQGALGGYAQRQQLDKYGRDEDALLALRRARGEEGLAGMDTAVQAAAALGSPPPASPAAPAPAQPAPVAPAAPAGGPSSAFMEAFAPMMPPASPAAPVAPASGLPVAPVAPLTAPRSIERVELPPSTARQAPARTAQAPGVAFVHPLGGEGRATSQYGAARQRGPHNGLDLAIAEGTPVAAAADGEVIQAWNDTANGGGNSVRIRHADGSITGYAHLANYNVQRGDIVRAGQPIGAVGSTGRSTGPHLHFTYRDAQGRRQNPARIQFGAVQATEEAQAEQPLNSPIPGVTTPEPEPVPLPTAPTAEPATQSPRLRSAYQMMRDANRYESAAAMTQMDTGLGEQGQFNEAAANRRADIADRTYTAALNRYGDAESQRRGAVYDARSQERQQGFTVANRRDEQAFDRETRATEQRYAMERAGFDRDTQLELARLNNSEDWRRLQAQIAASRGTEQERAQARRDGFYNTATGARLYDQAMTRMRDNGTVLDRLGEFERLLDSTDTGSGMDRLAPGVTSWLDSDRQTLESITQELSIAASGALKGAISDKEGDRILAMLPSIRRSPESNRQGIAMLRNAAERANSLEVLRLEAMANGTQVDFAREWNAYIDAVSVAQPTTFEEWKSSLTSYGANGRRTGGR